MLGMRSAAWRVYSIHLIRSATIARLLDPCAGPYDPVSIICLSLVLHPDSVPSELERIALENLPLVTIPFDPKLYCILGTVHRRFVLKN